MKNLTCTCCGGRINRATQRCEYCGTEYVINDNIPIIRMETYQNPIKEYKACMLLDNEAVIMYGNDYMEFAVKQLAKEMLPAVMEGMQMRIEDHVPTCQKKVTGRLKVVIPKR